MAEFSKDFFIKFWTFLSLKFSTFLAISPQNLNPRYVGAFAAISVAIFFGWRVTRSPAGPQSQSRPKRQSSTLNSATSTSQSNVILVPPSSIEDYAVDELFQPVMTTLGQKVRQKLIEGRKVTCQLLGVILEETSPEELQMKQATVRTTVLEVLYEIAKCCDLYLMERVLDDESEKKVILALQESGVFASGVLVKDKILFCSTENGRASFVRQLEPDWHIDTNPDIVFQLARFIKYQLHVTAVGKSKRPAAAAANVFISPSLEHFFGNQ